MNVSNITSKLLCSGCGTCNTICGQNAISMKTTDTLGLLYADVNQSKCVDCGLCLKLCPSQNILEERSNVTLNKIVGEISNCFIGRSLNKTIYSEGQSGGMVTSFLYYLLDKEMVDAVVSCRMDYGCPVPKVHYSIIINKEDLFKNQKSCYTQVDIVSALKEISHYKSVAVVGTPCQIQGVSNLTDLSKYKNIAYKIGLVCDKIYSNTYMEAIMSGIRNTHGEVYINYRKKNFSYGRRFYTYQQAPTVITDKEGNVDVIPSSKRMFLKDYFVVPKCRLCWDKLNTKADIVFGDPWGYIGEYDEKEGDSLILVRKEPIMHLLNDMVKDGMINIKPCDVQGVINGQHIEKRVIDVKSFDWENYSKAYYKKSTMLKKELLKKVYISYLISRFKSFVHKTMR